MPTIEIYKDRNDNYYVQAGDYKVRIADGTRHDGTTIGHFELVKNLTIPDVVNHVCPDPTHHAMDIGLMDKCSTCGATE